MCIIEYLLVKARVARFLYIFVHLRWREVCNRQQLQLFSDFFSDIFDINYLLWKEETTK